MLENPTLALKERILSSLRLRGPSLPVQISNELKVETLFVSAFLSELKAENRIKISNMKVGSSPLYYLPEHELQLENFIQHLNHREKEAFQMLKRNKVLEDKKQEPVVRVALREIKDFASPISVKIEGEIVTLWRYFSLTDTEFNEIANKVVFGEKENRKEEVKEKPKEDFEIKVEGVREEANKEREIVKKSAFEVKDMEERIDKRVEAKKMLKVLLAKTEVESEFLNKIKTHLKSKDIEILEVFLNKKKELEMKIRIDTLFGKQEFYFIAKDKKRISDDDLTITLQKAQNAKMPAILGSTGELNNKAKEYLGEWGNVIKFEKIKI